MRRSSPSPGRDRDAGLRHANPLGRLLPASRCRGPAPAGRHYRQADRDNRRGEAQGLAEMEAVLPRSSREGDCPAEGIPGSPPGQHTKVQPALLPEQEAIQNGPARTDLAHPGGGIVLDVIRKGWDRLVRFFTGGEEVTAGEVLVCVSAHSIMLSRIT